MGKELIPVASLARVSSAGQARDDREGLPRQRIAIDEAVQRHGLLVVEAFELPGVSGSLVGETPEWARIRALFKDGSIRGIACDAVDRVTRAQGYDLTVISDLHKLGATIYTPGGRSDMTNPNEGLMASILALFGGREVDEISRRFRNAKKSKRKNGGWTQGAHKLPLGITYNRDVKPHRWEYTDDISIVVDLHERYASGRGSIRSIAASLGLSNYQARRYLSHPMYRGKMGNLDGGLVAIDLEPAISPDLAARVDARRARRSRVYTGAARRKEAAGLPSSADDPDIYALRGVAHCARCGRKCDSVINRKKRVDGSGWYEWRLYRCTSSHRRSPDDADPCDAPGIPIRDAHNAVVVALLNHLSDKEPSEAVEAAIKLPDDPRPGEIERLRGRVAELESQRTRLLRVYTRGLIDESEFEGERKEVDRLLDAVRVELRGLEAEHVEIESAKMALIRFYQSALLDLSCGDSSGILSALRKAGGRVKLDRVQAVWPWGQDWTTREGVLVSARRRGWFTLVAWADIDVTRGLGLGAVEHAQMRTKNGPSSTIWPRT